jgi:hypothetical protein
MNEPEELERLATTDPGERILLLSHCMRPSATCPGKFSKRGLVCPDDCREDCAVGRLSRAALSLGYKGVCVAAGGAMAVRFVVEQDPRAIVAVACAKELGEGVDAVGAIARDQEKQAPAIVVVPLSKDGCVDTEVDEDLALETIGTGCRSGVAG